VSVTAKSEDEADGCGILKLLKLKLPMLPSPRPFKPGRLDKLGGPMLGRAPAFEGCRNDDDDEDEFGLSGVGFVAGAPVPGTAVVLLMAFRNSSHVVP